TVAGNYALAAGATAGFDLASYDASRPLVIDPALSFSTYLGGSDDDWASDIAVDGDGNVYVAGCTGSTDFPTEGAFQDERAGGYDAFVAKFDPTGSELLYATYLGGTGNEAF